MAYAPMQMPEPDPKIVVVGITIEHGKVRVRPEHVRVRLGQEVSWRVLSFDGGELISLQVYFNEGTPFKWKGQFTVVDPEDFKVTPRRPQGTQPNITASPHTPGDFKYGVRMLDVHGHTLDDDDPYISVL